MNDMLKLRNDFDKRILIEALTQYENRVCNELVSFSTAEVGQQFRSKRVTANQMIYTVLGLVPEENKETDEA